MKKFSWKTTSLLILPLLVLVVAATFNYWQSHKPVDDGITGGWKNAKSGDRAALSKILFDLKQRPLPDIYKCGYTTPEADGNYLSEVKRGTRPYQEWVYTFEYIQSEKTLIKRLFTSNPHKPPPAQVWVWTNVTENAIHQVAGPVLELKTTFAIEAYKGGNLSDLEKYGARLQQTPPKS